MSEPTRPMPNPKIRPDGHWDGAILFTPPEMNTRALFTLPVGPVVPIIFVPGIMGSNLRAKLHPDTSAEQNRVLAAGQAAWRAPNGGVKEKYKEVHVWEKRDPRTRQLILDGDTLEVDDSGEISLPSEIDGYTFTKDDARRQGWGEVHADSYGALLVQLEHHLNTTFAFNENRRTVQPYWQEVMKCDPKRWGVAEIEPLTVDDLNRSARCQYPVYACGYNWLRSSWESSERLERRVVEIIGFWKSRRRKCEKVILVTHSMGGLVARACAKRIPDKIAGVIHSVMPALGAPAAYRRIASGTESSNPSMTGYVAAQEMEGFAAIAGKTTSETTAVLATAPGALELLPNHRYPRPWLYVDVIEEGKNSQGSRRTVLSLPRDGETPYALYADFSSWHRLINPALADPARKYATASGGVEAAIRAAIDKAQRFHMMYLRDAYHPNTYVVYAADPDFKSFGEVRWIARLPAGSGAVATASGVERAKFHTYTAAGGRRVNIEGKAELSFELAPQDTAGDGTVPRQSGAGPAGRVKQMYSTRGYSHQGAYSDPEMQKLTLYLIAKIVSHA